MRSTSSSRHHDGNAGSTREAFLADGFIVIRKLLSVPQVAHYRSLLLSLADDPAEPEAYRKRPGAFAHVDGVTQREPFWPLIFNERLLASARTALDDDVRFIRHADLHVNHPVAPSWHHDGQESSERIRRRMRTIPAEVKVARVGIYLSPGMVFGVIAGSHRHPTRAKDRWARATNALNKAFGRISRSYLFAPPFGPTVWLRLDPGDCVLFDVRLWHTGHYPASGKCAVFLAFGAPNIHSAMHSASYLERPDLAGVAMPPALQWRLAEAGLYLEEAAPAGDEREAPRDLRVPLGAGAGSLTDSSS